MKKTKNTKLTVNRQTLRQLSTVDMNAVAGGASHATGCTDDECNWPTPPQFVEPIKI